MGPGASPPHLHENRAVSGHMPSQQSFYHNGPPVENVSLTNRPRFDQISDATKYVFNQHAQNAQMDPNMATSGAMYSYQPQPTTMNVGFHATAASNAYGQYVPSQADMQHSNHANHVIEEEDYQQSSHAQFGKLGASFVANEENQVIRTQQQFKTQKADFEARSHASETASDGR